MAFEAGLGAAAGFRPLCGAMVLSGIMAVLIDLDHVALPPHRTPAGHSLPSAVFWMYVPAAMAASFCPGALEPAVLAAGSAIFTHLSLDAFTDGGIFLWPRNCRLREWVQPVSEESLACHRGRFFLISDEKGYQDLLDGRLAWPAWRRLRLPLPGRLGPGGPLGDAVLSFLGLVGVLLAVIAD